MAAVGGSGRDMSRRRRAWGGGGWKGGREEEVRWRRVLNVYLLGEERAFRGWGQVTASRERVHSPKRLCVVYLSRLFLPLFLLRREFTEKGQLALSGTVEQKCLYNRRPGRERSRNGGTVAQKWRYMAESVTNAN